MVVNRNGSKIKTFRIPVIHYRITIKLNIKTNKVLQTRTNIRPGTIYLRP